MFTNLLNHKEMAQLGRELSAKYPRVIFHFTPKDKDRAFLDRQEKQDWEKDYYPVLKQV